MLGHNDYQGLLRKYIIMFGSLFDDISVERKNSAGQIVQTVTVPIAYGPKEKWLSRISQDPTLNKYVAIVLPRMGFELQAMTYDPNRKLSSTQQNVKAIAGVDNQIRTQYTPVPYNLEMQLSVYTRNAEDGANIIEQILPYFTPDFTVTMIMNEAMGIKMDIPVILTSVTTEDIYEGDFETRRSLIWNMSFTIKGYLYGPTKKSSIIKRAQADAVIVPGADPIIPSDSSYGRVDRIVAQPGLTVAGQPTTDVAASIPYTSIHPSDPFGLASDITLYTDGLKYDPVTGTDK